MKRAERTSPATAVQQLVRRTLRSFTNSVPVRGRHRLVYAILGRLGTDTEVVDFGSLKIRIDHSIAFSRAVYYGVYEEHLVNWIRQTLRPGDRVIEPGTNIGFIASQILNAIGGSGLLISLEPSRRCCSALQAENSVGTRSDFVLLNAALSSQSGVEAYYESERIVSRGYGCLEAAGRPDDATRYDIETHSVDDLVERFGIDKLRFLKLDIEGSELPALQGARRTLDKGGIDFVMVETDIDPGSTEKRRISEGVTSILSRSGFRPHWMLRTGKLLPFDIDAAHGGSARIRTDVMWTR